MNIQVRNPHTFPQPNDFEPERWNGIAEHEVGMFGVGPRACIGMWIGHSIHHVIIIRHSLLRSQIRSSGSTSYTLDDIDQLED